MELKIKRVMEGVELPTYSTEGAGAFDIRAYGLPDEGVIINHGDIIKMRTGIAIEIPDGWSLMIIPRSGLGSKYGLTLANSTGLIDSDYRGEIGLTIVRNDNNVLRSLLHINNGDRVAQGILVQTPQFKIVEVDELSETVRGVGGHGSTGVK